MNDIPANAKADAKLTDEQIAALLNEGGGSGKRKKRDDRLPSPRLPEALYMYLFTVFAGLLLMGVWGYMVRGVDEVMSRGPRQNAPWTDHLMFNLRSTWEGFSDQAVQRPYIVAGIILGCLAVFVPRSSRGRKRMMQLLCALIVAAFGALITLQFTADMKLLTTPRL